MKHIAEKEQNLYIHSMNRALRITAIFTDAEECNKHCAAYYDAVVAVFGGFIFCANRGDNGKDTIEF